PFLCWHLTICPAGIDEVRLNSCSEAVETDISSASNLAGAGRENYAVCAIPERETISAAYGFMADMGLVSRKVRNTRASRGLQHLLLDSGQYVANVFKGHRLDQVQCNAGLFGKPSVPWCCVTRHSNYEWVLPFGHGPQASRQLVAVHLGQGDIQKNDVG